MLQLTIIGHLGADAEIKQSNGHQFVSFRVAHSEAFSSADGQRKERTQWVSCALNGDGGNLFQYLKKGTQVCVVGNATFGVASSQIQRAMVATCNVHVRSIELLGGGNTDDVPRQLADATGLLHDTMKIYTVSAETWKQLNPGPQGCQLYDARGNSYTLDAQGYITRNQQAQPADTDQPANSEENG